MNKMKILLVMDPGILVPPKGYGGIERVVALLATEYRRQGHQVTILATEGSFVEGCTINSIGKEGFPPLKKEMNKAVFRAWKFLWKNRNSYDLVHNFGRLVYLLPILNHPVKKIMSYQREITRRNIQVFNALPNKNMVYTGCSADLVKRANAPGKWFAIHNAIDFNQFTLTENLSLNAPLIFLGRIERIKGCHTAIEVAKKTNNHLIIAGNISHLPEEIEYFEKIIKPLIDGDQIMFVGEVNDEQKNDWLGKAKALLMPIEWDEPFGIVMIEAMACGAPVIGFNRGSVNEVVDQEITGFKTKSLEEMCKAVDNLSNTNRATTRKEASKRFASFVIANQYLALGN